VLRRRRGPKVTGPLAVAACEEPFPVRVDLALDLVDLRRLEVREALLVRVIGRAPIVSMPHWGGCAERQALVAYPRTLK
jgi:hypothetical protein